MSLKPQTCKPTGDRDLDCEVALTNGFDGLIAAGKTAGYSTDEILNALLSLAQQRVADRREDAQLASSSAAAKRSLH